MKKIIVKSAGMFAPQEKGACKLTLIISEEDIEAQNYAFAHLRYTDVEIGLAGASQAKVQNPVEVIIKNLIHAAEMNLTQLVAALDEIQNQGAQGEPKKIQGEGENPPREVTDETDQA